MCDYADDAYLIAEWPQVAVSSRGEWIIAIDSVAVGDYSITVGGVPYAYTADGTETKAGIRDALLLSLSMSLAFTASPTGSESAPSITVAEVVPGGLTLSASGPSGPAPSEVTVTVVSGGDNATQRAFWLERAKCGVPCCSYFCGCSEDYTLFHASLAASYILEANNTDASGKSVNDFKRLELGPAKLEAGGLEFATPTETLLGRTRPGQMVIMLRRRYLPPFFCG